MNSSGVAKDLERKPTDFSSPLIESRTPASSSMTNTVGGFLSLTDPPQSSLGRVKPAA